MKIKMTSSSFSRAGLAEHHGQRSLSVNQAADSGIFNSFLLHIGS